MIPHPIQALTRRLDFAAPPLPLFRALTRDGTRAHTVSKDGGGWGSGTLSVGKTFSRTFNVRGTIKYHCNFHSTMHGTIVVQ